MTESTTTDRTYSPWAIASLACSLGGFLFFPGSVLGIVFGYMARKGMLGQPNLQGAGLATAGIILGYIGVVLSVLFWLTVGGLFWFIGIGLLQS